LNLLDKYNTQAPRYTSYPTVPFWTDTPSQDQWKHLVGSRLSRTNTTEGISLYIHLPFCESLCTYCACNTRITVNHRVEEPYIDTLLKEWQLYLDLFQSKPRIREIHLGGGTPTFFSPGNLTKLISAILATADICPDHDFSFEGHPANTTREHLQVLYNLGFRRVSFGVQDFDTKVQEAINRYQSFEEVEYVTGLARQIGYTSVNYDLVYGLPHQSRESVADTVGKVVELRPDRIAFYSYAHVPWLRPGQRKYSEADLPKDQEKRALYELGKESFLQTGYADVGMDHFTLKSDPLFSAWKNGKLHRNFMGYTDKHTELSIGLGASAISDTWNGFSQNIKTVEPYQAAVRAGKLPIHKGHILSQEDLVMRKHILDIMCKGQTEWETIGPGLYAALERCAGLEADGLVELSTGCLKVTPVGIGFLRNICMCFDQRYWEKIPTEQLFSTIA
jgi:oxygen-independent coproporphyrinogen III oxidase